MTAVQANWTIVLVIGIVALAMVLDSWAKAWRDRARYRADAERERARAAELELTARRERADRDADQRSRSILGSDFPFHYESTTTRHIAPPAESQPEPKSPTPDARGEVT